MYAEHCCKFTYTFIVSLLQMVIVFLISFNQQVIADIYVKYTE